MEKTLADFHFMTFGERRAFARRKQRAFLDGLVAEYHSGNTKFATLEEHVSYGAFLLPNALVGAFFRDLDKSS